MGVLVFLFYFAVVPAIIAAVLGNSLPKLLPNSSLRRRSLIAAVVAGFLPALLPIGAILLSDTSGYGGVGLAVMLVLALLTTVMVGLPVALLVRRGKEDQPHSGAPFE